VTPDLLKNTTADFEHLLKSLFFIPFDKNGAGHFPVLFLGWTLNYEMYFYLIFGICSYLFYKKRDIFCALILIIIILSCKTSTNIILSVYANPIVIEFILGMIAYRILYEKKIDLHLLILSVIGLVPILIYLPEKVFASETAMKTTIEAVQVHVGYGRVMIEGFLMFLVFFIFYYAFSKKRLPNQLSLLGGGSYSLYLTHPYIIQGFEKVVPLFGKNIYIDLVCTITVLLITILISIVIYKRFESPLNKMLRGYLNNRNRG